MNNSMAILKLVRSYTLPIVRYDAWLAEPLSLLGALFSFCMVKAFVTLL